MSNYFNICDGSNLTNALPHGIAISAGLYDGRNVEYIRVQGVNPDVDAAGTDEDIWNGGGLYTGFPTGAAETLTIVSDSAADDLGSTGAEVIRLYGVTASGIRFTEDKTLDGLTPVVTTNTFYRLLLTRVIQSGTAKENIGSITIRHTTTTANVFAVMPPGQGRSKVCAYTIPAGKQGVVVAFRSSMKNNAGAGTGAAIRASLYSRLNDTDTFEDLGTTWVQSNSGVSEVRLDGGIALPEDVPLPALTDLVMRAESGASADNLHVVASFALFMWDV